MRKFWIVFIVLAVVVFGGLGLVWRGLSSLDSGGPTTGRVLYWQAAGEYPETSPDGFLEQLQLGDVLTHHQLLLALKRAATDPVVETLVLDLRGLAVNWAQLEELHAAVAHVRDRGKMVWAYIESGGNADYALATAADIIAMAPEGSLMVLGVAAELAFLRDTLAMAGIDADFLHVGRYKSAPEQLTRSEASEANREVTTSLVEARYAMLVDLIATGRGTDNDTARRWIDTGMHDGVSALAVGMVDTLLDVGGLIGGIYPEDDVADLASYARGGRRSKAQHEVALVVAAGTIYPGESRHDPMQGRILGSDTVIDQLARAREDDRVGAVVLRVHSPGGSALASDLIWNEVARVREAKPVVVSMGGYAASGGYYIACGADSIFADRGTLTGSIGVFAGKLDWSGLYAKLRIRRELIARGENALLWHDGSRFTPGQRALFQDQLDRFYERFVAKVADGRGLTPAQVDAAAQGRVWTGEQALAHGLVDGLGGLDRAIVSAKATLGLGPDDPVRLRTYGTELTWLERTMLDALRSQGAAPLARRVLGAATPWDLPAPLAATAAALAEVGLFESAPLLDGRPLALMPWRDMPRQGSVSRP